MPHPAGCCGATGLCLGASVSSLLCEKKGEEKSSGYICPRPRSSPQSFKTYDVGSARRSNRS
jgi:hypothetical protein